MTVNGLAAWKLSGGKTLNEKVLNWHLLEDVLGWVAVLIVSIVLLFADWPILDPILSIAFTLFILANVWKRLLQTIRLFMQAAPDENMAGEIKSKLLALNQVDDIHHLHLWSLDGEHHVLTAHLVLEADIDGKIQEEVKEAVRKVLDDYDFAHTTIELEQSAANLIAISRLLVLCCQAVDQTHYGLSGIRGVVPGNTRKRRTSNIERPTSNIEW